MSDGSMRGWTQAADGTWLPPGEAVEYIETEEYVEADQYVEADEATLHWSERSAETAAVGEGSMRGWTQAADGTWMPPEDADLVLAPTERLPVVKPAAAKPAKPAPTVRRAAAGTTTVAKWQDGHLVGVAIACLVIGGFIGAALFGDDGGANRASGATSVPTTQTTLSPDDPRFAPPLFSTTTLPGLGGQGQGQNSNQNTNTSAGLNQNLGGTTTIPLFGLSPSVTSPAGNTGSPTAAPLTSFVGEGTFRVGVDIQPGTYRSLGPAAADSVCYWERQATFGDSTSVLDSRSEVGQAVVNILATDRGFRTSRCQRWDRIG